MDTIKDFWYAVIDITNDPAGMIDSVHRFERDAYEQAAEYTEVETKVERVRITIDRIKV